MILSPKQHQAIHNYGLMLFAFLLPLSAKFATIILVTVLLNWFLGGQLKIRLNSLKSWGSLLFLVFFAWHFLALSYTEDLGMGFHKLETKLSFLVFPLLILAPPGLKSTKPYAHLLWAFILGNTMTAILSVGAAIWTFFSTGEQLFFYQDLSGFLRLHPTYFAANLGIALFLLIQDRLKFPTQRSWLKDVMIGGLTFTFILLSARMAFLAVLFLGSISWLIYAARQPEFFKRLALGTSIIGVVGILLFVLPGPKKRIQNALQNNGSSNVRWEIWDASWDLIQQHPLLGLGTGDAPSELVQRYQALDYQVPLEKKLNAHNQYLQTTLAIGLPGGLFLIFLLLFFFFTFLKKGSYEGAFFIALCSLLFLTESMLETQKGNLWFGFFCMFFWWKSQSSTPQEAFPSLFFKRDLNPER